MFTIKSLFNSEKVTDAEKDIIISYISAYKDTNFGQWIINLDLSKINYYWCKDMTDQNNVLGAWNPLFYNNIYLKYFDKSKLTGNKYKDQLIYDFHFGLIIPTVFHEMYHKYQCQKFTLPIYAILAFPIWREYTIEPSAYKISDNASDWMMLLDEQQFKDCFNELHLDFYRIKF